MRLPRVTLAMKPHSAARDSRGISSRLTSVSRTDLVRGGGGSAAMAPLRRVDDSDEQEARRPKARELNPGRPPWISSARHRVHCTLIGTPALRPPAPFIPRVEPRSRKRRPESQHARPRYVVA